jgi:hypothetical protein
MKSGTVFGQPVSKVLCAGVETSEKNKRRTGGGAFSRGLNGCWNKVGLLTHGWIGWKEVFPGADWAIRIFRDEISCHGERSFL